MTRLTRFIGAALMTGAMVAEVPAQSPAPASQDSSASILYCQVGGVGLQPPDDPERFFGIAVIEVASPTALDSPKVASFNLVDSKGVARSRVRRVTDVLEFTRPRTEKEGIAAYYGNSTGNRPWNGTLPSGVTRLQIRVSFDRYPQAGSILDLRCQLAFGPHTMERGIDSVWPT